MKRPPLKLVVSALSLALVLLLFALDAERTSPGPLSPVHAQVPELAGEDGCSRCHDSLTRTMAEACSRCHAQVVASIDAGRGLHGTLAGVDAKQCAACHVEHHGADVELAGARAFALAGVPDARRFDHAALGFRLEGVHVELDCARCHAHADAALLAPGTPRFLGLAQDCASCHADPHQGRMARACADCHGQSEPFAVVAEFDHRDAFVSRGAHARAKCLDCHDADGPRSVEALGGGGATPERRACVDCHASPHAGEFVERFSVANALAPGESCLACHAPEHGPFESARVPEGIAWHAATGFPLETAHARVACAQCHASRESVPAFAGRYPRRAPDDCAACHADPHQGSFDGRELGREGCIGCHERTHYAPAKFGPEQHARTAFPLEGAHASVACARCHVAPPAGSGAAAVAASSSGAAGATGSGARAGSTPADALDFAAAETACAACHADAHAGRFATPALAARFPELAERGCGACHDTESFDHGARERFDHAALTSFALDGAHARAACETCHAPAAAPDAAGRRFGRARGTGACATCHPDPHGGAFDAAEPAGAQSDRGCARCHTTESFADGARAGFDHALAGFELAGAHARAGCESCHPPLARPTAEGRRWTRAAERFGVAPRGDARAPAPLVRANAPGVPPGDRGDFESAHAAAWTQRCESCHADPHRGRFARAPGEHGVADAAGPTGHAGAPDARAGCERCHTNEAFRPVDPAKFDHGAWTGFALAGAHASTACAACHAPRPAGDEPARALGAAPGTACHACHADPHAGQFAEAAGTTDCARCHASDRPFRDIEFDHARDTRFALDATHASLACSACHVPSPTAGGASVVRYRPLGVRCADCHGGSERAGKGGG